MVECLGTFGLLRLILSTVFYNISIVFRVFLLSRDSTLMVDRLGTLGLLRSLLSTVFYNISTVFRVFLLSR